MSIRQANLLRACLCCLLCTQLCGCWLAWPFKALNLLNPFHYIGSDASFQHSGGVPGSQSYVINGKRYYPLRSAKGFRQEGVASWYGEDFHGKKTANGERYDMYGMTAAHPILPLGTQIRVTNIANGQSVVVRVNDRGPFVGNRVVDLTYTAAKKLGMLQKGTARVRIVAL